MPPRISTLSRLCFALMLLLTCCVAKSASAQSWLGAGWQYRRTITVSNTSNASALTAYQVKITLTSSNFDFSKAKGDGSDLRVTDSTGNAILPYFIQSYSATSRTATIWVRLISLAARAQQTIYLYYGNSNPPAFTVPPTGTFVRPTNADLPGIVENMVYDNVTAQFYVVYTTDRFNLINMASAPTPLGPWTDLGTILAQGDSGTWDGGIVYAPHLMQSNNTWYLYYTGCPQPTSDGDGDAVGVATSESITGPYTRASTNPQVRPTGSAGSWEQYRASEPYVYYSTILNKWVMLYMGDAGQGAASSERVGYATATNLLGPWTKASSNPIINFGPTPSWDAGTVADPHAVEVDGTTYIFYTGGPTALQPWLTGFAQTRDFQTFTKGHIVYGRGSTGEWDSANAFRGAMSRGVLQWNNYWFFPYSSISGWSIAYTSALSTARGFDPLSVFDYYDEFSGSSLDANKWGQAAQAMEGGGDSVSNNILTMNSGVGTYHTLVGRREFGMGHLMEVTARRYNADGTGNHAAELGFGLEDRSSVVRLYDYTGSALIANTQITNTGTAQALPAGSTTASFPDTSWHTHRIAFVGPSQVKFQVDTAAWTSLTTNVPAISLKPWMFVYSTPGYSTSMDVSSVIVRKYADVEPTLTIGTEAGNAIAVPAAPTNVRATAADTQITLTWTASTSATSYKIYRSLSAGVATTTAYQTGVTGTSFTDTSLTNGTTYYYRVAAVGSSGTSVASAEVSARPALSLTAGPTTSDTTTTATINWTTGSPSTTKVIYGRNGQLTSTYTQSGSVTSHSVRLTGLRAYTTYSYQVISTNGNGSTVTSAVKTFYTD